MTLNGCTALGGRDFNLKVAICRKRCKIGPRLQLITNRKSYTGFDWHQKQWPWMTLSTNRGFYGFYICSQWAFIHALLSRVPFALAGLSCFNCFHLATVLFIFSKVFVFVIFLFVNHCSLAIIIVIIIILLLCSFMLNEQYTINTCQWQK